MTEKSYFWQDSSVGDATLAPYDADEFQEFFRLLLNYERTVSSVLSGYLQELLVAYTSGDNVRVYSGAAIVDGTFYKNSTFEDFGATRPGAPGTNVQKIVLRKTWADKEVKAAILAPGAALTQNDGVVWEVEIASVSVPFGTGAITVDLSAKRWLHSNGNHIPKILLASGDDNFITFTKPRSDFVMICGASEWTGAAANSGSLTITPVPWYTSTPYVVVTPAFAGTGVIRVSTVPSTTNLVIHWKDNAGTNRTAITFYWIAYGRRKRAI